MATVAPAAVPPVAPVGVRRILRWLTLATAAVVAAHLAFLVLRHGFDRDYVYGLAPLFDMWGERSVPAWHASAMWLFGAGLLWLAGQADPGLRLRWTVLALVAAYLSMDESLSLHERLIVPLRTAFATRGMLHFPWVVPYLAAVAVLGIAYLPFLRRIPRATAVRLVVAGAVFVGGAAGMEMVSGLFFEVDPDARTVLLDVLVLIEETLELTGLLLFIRALLLHLATTGATFRGIAH